MKDIAVYGAGGFGREVACLLNRINSTEAQWNLIGFIDDVKNVGDENEYGKVLGGIDYLNSYSQELNVVIAIGSPHGVASIASKICNDNIVFPNIIHPDFNIVDPKTFKIGKGNIIQGGCSVSCDVAIGDFNVFNGSITLGHDDNIGNYNSFMPAIRISGGVTVGNCNFFGVGSIVLQRIKIGNNIRLGAGSVLMTKPKDGNLYMGNPAKKMIL
ncbi:serine acetyltransferase [Bacteroides sp.]|uniref:PglD-related sugar-binding protein n=1 Tax=Bacteroides sp. TaxID=29523 RepID=UPI00260BACD9|nr:serine acetyltransferase [Bacteroides sp.]